MKKKDDNEIIEISEGWSNKRSYSNLLLNNRILERLMALCLLILGIYALLLILRDGYFEGINIGHCMRYLVPLAIGLTIILDLRDKYKWPLLIVLLIVAGYYVYANYKVFYYAFFGNIYYIGKWIAWYLGDSLISVPVNVNYIAAHYMDECAALCCVPWTVFNCISWSNRAKPVTSLFATAIYFGMFFCGGYMPNFIPLLLLVISVFAVVIKNSYYPTENNTKKRSYFKNISRETAFLVFGLAAFLLYGNLLKPVSKIVLPIQDFVYDGYSLEKVDLGGEDGKDASGGISGGKTGKGGISFKPKGEKIFDITFDNDTFDEVYLRAYIADTYDGEGWINTYNPMDYMYGLDSTPYDVLSSEHDLISKYSSSGILATEGQIWQYRGFYNAKINMAAIKSVSPGLTNDGYVLFPYLSIVSENDGKISDGYYMTQNVKKDSKTYFDFYEYEGGFSLDSAFFDDYHDYLENVTKNDKGREKYINKKYAYECCLEVPDFLSDIYDKYSGMAKESIEENILFVKQELTDGFTYNTSPPVTPKNKDFINYFLFESKSGYCMYYASAATMIFRSMGIPARYVEGYLVPESKAGVEMVVKDSNAHAWVEIYLDSFGWIPVEVTNANFTGTGFEPTSEADESKESTSARPNQTTASQTKPNHSTEVKETTVKKTSAAKENTGGNGNKTANPLPEALIWIIYIALAVGVIILLYYGSYYLFYALPLKKTLQMSYKNRMMKTYRRIYRLTKRQIPFVAEGDAEAIAEYWELKQNNVELICEALMAAEYGKRDITKDECELAEKIEEKILMRKNKKAKGIGKLITLRKLRIRRKIYAGK